MKRKSLIKLFMLSFAIAVVPYAGAYAQEAEDTMAEEIEVEEAEITEYQVDYVYDSSQGSVVGPYTVVPGEDIRIQVKAELYYHILSVQYQSADGLSAWELTPDQYGYVVIPAEMVSEDGSVNVEFEEDGSYRIIEGNIAQGHICAQCSDHYSAAQELIDDSEISVTAGKTAVVVLYSQNWSGGDEWYLNKLEINGEDIRTPLTYKQGDVVETELRNGVTASVRLESVDTKDPHVGKNNRHKYTITLSDAREDMTFDANFKKSGRREMIFNDLDGIEAVGGSVEKRYYKAVGKIGYHYDYNFTVNESNVYKTFNQGSSASRNIYAYKVKPGYDPDSVSVLTYYDGVARVKMSPKFPQGSSLREIAKGYKTNFRHLDSFLVGSQDYGFEYGFALDQHSAHNQVCYLEAQPYVYEMEYQLNGGEYSEDSMDLTQYSSTEDGQGLVEDKSYTIADGETAAYAPIAEPVREGYRFLGWTLQTDTGVILQANSQFLINEESINAADEWNRFVFQAEWEEIL